MRINLLFIGLLGFILVAAACAGPQAVLDAKQEAGDGVPELDRAQMLNDRSSCPVTQPPIPPFVPPQLWPAQPPGQVSNPEVDQFWYGSPELWTALPRDGSWPQLALGEKFWWWSERFDVQEDDTPDLVVTARRLDGEAPEFKEDQSTNGYHAAFHWAMLVGVELPTPGCWEVTGAYKGQELSVVVWVPSE